MTAFSATKFDKQVEKDLDRIRLRLKKVAFKATEYGMNQVSKLSPVWSGSYVSSHRIGIGLKNDSGPVNLRTYSKTDTYGKGLPDKVSPGTAAKMRVEASLRPRKRIQINKLKNSDRIIIYNQSEHALKVEMLADTTEGGNFSPYYPYEKSKQRLLAKIYSIIEQVR